MCAPVSEQLDHAFWMGADDFFPVAYQVQLPKLSCAKGAHVYHNIISFRSCEWAVRGSAGHSAKVVLLYYRASGTRETFYGGAATGLLKTGTFDHSEAPALHEWNRGGRPQSLFLAENIMESYAKVTANDWRGTGFYFDRKRVDAVQGFSAPRVQTTSAVKALNDVLNMRAPLYLRETRSTDASSLKSAQGQAVSSRLPKKL